MKLAICIPTYNRREYLKKNIEKLCADIKELALTDEIMIYISDNGSTDGTDEYIEALLQSQNEVVVKYNRNEKNIGSERNHIFLICNADTEYIMLLGDDDYIAKEYLKRVYSEIEANVSCIIPSYMNVDKEDNYIGRGRDLDCATSFYEAGYKNCLKNSWRGHQMSGLVFLRQPLQVEFERIDVSDRPSLYYSIYATAYMCLHGSVLHLTDFPVHVTRPPQNEKAWGYGEDGLIPEIFLNYKQLEGISLGQRHKLEMQFLTKQYWRYAMYIKKGIGKFFLCVGKIISSDNTSIYTKISFLFTFLLILIGQAFKLLFTGKLFGTLKTKVDI